MNWREDISTALFKIRVDKNIDFDNILDVEEKIILPSLTDISNELRIWYEIYSEIDDNELKIL